MSNFPRPIPRADSFSGRAGVFVSALPWLAVAGTVAVLGLTPAADGGGDAAPAAIDSATHTGPRGAVHFCMAPPVPQRNEPAPYPEFAPPLRDYRLTASEAAARFGAPDTSHVLFILAAFADVPFDTAGIDTTGIHASTVGYDRETIIVDFFTRQLGFVREYYHDVSYGKHVVDPVVHETVVTLPFPMAYYGDDDLFGERGTKLIWDAVSLVDADVDFGEFDGLAILHSDYGQESDVSNNSKEQIWSAFFPQPLLSVVLTDSLGYAVPGIPTGDFTAEGDTVYVEGAAILPESESQDGFNFGLMGVYTHELGHVMLGWPDLYDTTGDTPSQGLGSYCLMAAGTWNANGNVPGEPSAWCRMYAGWTTPLLVDPAPGERVDLSLTYLEKDDPDPDDVLLARVPISGDEYFLLANLDPDHDGDETFDWAALDPENPLVNFWADSYEGAEFDFFLPNEIPGSPVGTYKEPSGLSVWHIDESVVTFGFPFNIVNGDPRHHGIDLEEADGVQDLEFPAYTILSFGGPDDLFRAGEADRFTPSTEPNTAPTFGGAGTVSLLDIGEPGPEISLAVERTGGEGSPGAPAIHALYPQSYPSAVSEANPLVTNLDGSPEAEVVVVDDAGAVHVTTFASGAPEWSPLELDPPRGSPTVGRATDAGVVDIVVATQLGDVHAVRGTNPLSIQATVFVDSMLVGDGTLIDVDGDGLDEYVIGSTDEPNDSTAVPGRLHTVHLDTGTVDTVEFESAPAGPVAGIGDGEVVTPLAFGGLAHVDLAAPGAPPLRVLDDEVRFGPPASGDLDRDGAMDVVCVGDDGRVHAFEMRDGLTAVWTAAVGGVPRSGVSLADLDDDGFLDVLTLGTSGSLHAFNYNGVAKPGWPVIQDVAQDVYFDFTEPAPAPLAADVDGDGALELLPVFADGRVDVFDVTTSSVRKVAGLSFQAGPGSVPVIGDFDADGNGELFLLESVRDRFGAELWNRATTWNLGSAFGERADAWTMYRGHPSGNAASAGSPSGVAAQPELLADVYCQPNPAGPDGAWVHYRLAPNADHVRIEIYDAAGQGVRKLSGTLSGGVDNLVRWDGKTESGAAAAPGLYVYRVTARGDGKMQAVVGKMALVR